MEKRNVIDEENTPDTEMVLPHTSKLSGHVYCGPGCCKEQKDKADALEDDPAKRLAEKVAEDLIADN
jgi:hypothetical protein